MEFDGERLFHILLRTVLIFSGTAGTVISMPAMSMGTTRYPPLLFLPVTNVKLLFKKLISKTEKEYYAEITAAPSAYAATIFFMFFIREPFLKSQAFGFENKAAGIYGAALYCIRPQ
jgi:hypothetical protein